MKLTAGVLLLSVAVVPFSAEGFVVVEQASLRWQNNARFFPQTSSAPQSFLVPPSCSFFALRMSAMVEDTSSQQQPLLDDVASSAVSSSLQSERFAAAKNSNAGLFNQSLLVVMAMFSAFLYLGTTHSTIWHGWTTTEILDRIPIDAWGLYSMALHHHPIFTKACTSAAVYTIGDIISQRSQGGDAPLDSMRVLRSMAAGGIGHGPLSHCWYNVCDGFFDHVLHWTAWWVLFPKVVVDQLVWGPIWNNTYIAMLGIMKRESPGKIVEDVRRSTIPLLVAGLKLWPAAHLVTYGLIPVENRLLWVDFVEIAWVTILASQASANDDVATAEPANDQLEEKAAY